MIWLAATAVAHPLGSTACTQTTILTVHRDRLEVSYTAEVADDLMRPRPAALEPLQDMALELSTGLVLQADGSVVPLRRTGEAESHPGSEHTTVFVLRFEADRPPGARSLRVSTTNLLDARNVYAAEVRVHPALSVVSASTLELRDGRVVQDDGLRWRDVEEARTVEVVLGAETAAPVAWLLGRDGPPVRAGAAVVRPLRARLTPPSVDDLGLAALALVAVLVGAGRPASSPIARTWSPALLGPLLASVPTAGWSELLLAAVAAALWFGAAHAWAPAVVLAGLATTTHAPRAAFALVVVGYAAGQHRRSAGARLPALLGVALVLGRGVLWLSAP